MITLPNQSLRFLLIEDDPEDYSTLEQLCKTAFGSQLQLSGADNYQSAITAINKDTYDIYLLADCHGSQSKLLEHINKQPNQSPSTILLAQTEEHISESQDDTDDYLIKEGLTARALKYNVRTILKNKDYTNRLIKLEYYDSLTGLANRVLFNQELKEWIDLANNYEETLALLLLNIDNFKDINNSEGHTAGDQLLQEASKTICQIVEDNDTVARLGGDEFAIITNNVKDKNHAETLAEKIINAFDRNFILNGKKIPITTSIGIAIYPSDSTNKDELLKQADLALYEAKKSGRNRYSFFDKNLDLAIRYKKHLQAEMASALINNHFVLYYQPIIDANSKTIVSVEALMRWRHPEKGLIAPDEFIPIAESSGFIIPLGDWMIREACRQKREWIEQGMPDFSIAINLAASQFYNDKLIQLLNSCISDHKLSKNNITLEITESTLLENTDDISERINKLHNLGYSFSLDDFGTGYSSLAYLKRFPVSKIKIDRSMVVDIPINKENTILCEAIVSIGKAFDIEIIAEGVETHEQLEYLRNIGCHQIQGYAISRPLAPENLCLWLKDYKNLDTQSNPIQKNALS